MFLFYTKMKDNYKIPIQGEFTTGVPKLAASPVTGGDLRREKYYYLVAEDHRFTNTWSTGTQRTRYEKETMCEQPEV